MNLKRLKDYNILIKLLLTGKSYNIKALLSRTTQFNYSSLYNTLSNWAELKLVDAESVENKLPGGMKIEYKVTLKGRLDFQEINEKASNTISKEDVEQILEKISEVIKSDASEIIETGMSNHSGAQLLEYLLSELVDLFQDRIYDVFDNYNIIPK